MFFEGLCLGEVVERELFLVLDILQGVEHHVVPLVGDHDPGLAVRVAAVGKSAGEIPPNYGVNVKDLSAVGLRGHFLDLDVVELDYLVLPQVAPPSLLAPFDFLQETLDGVLSNMPQPGGVHLSVIGRDDLVGLDAVFVGAYHSQSLAGDS